MATKATKQGAKQGTKPPKLTDLLHPAEIAEQRAYHRRMINEALGRTPQSPLDLLDVLRFASQEQAAVERLLARLDALGPAAPDAPSRRRGRS